MPRITKRVVDGLAADPAGDRIGWDSELRGFGVRMKLSGECTYPIQFRNAEGRSRRMTLGSVTVLKIEDARELARTKLALVRRGEDPLEQRQALKTAPTVVQVCDWYLEEAEAGRLLGRRRRPIAASTLALDRSRIETHVKTLLGSKTRLDVHDRTRLPPVPAPSKGQGGGKESPDHHRNRACQQYARPFSMHSRNRPLHAARTAVSSSLIRICQSSTRPCGQSLT